MTHDKQIFNTMRLKHASRAIVIWRWKGDFYYKTHLTHEVSTTAEALYCAVMEELKEEIAEAKLKAATFYKNIKKELEVVAVITGHKLTEI